MNNNRDTIVAESLNTKINKTYNNKIINVVYNDDTALINISKEILANKISTITQPLK